MTSITTQNVSQVAAASDLSQTARNNSIERQHNASPTKPDAAVQSVVNAQAATVIAKSDEQRNPAAPKQVDAGFSPQTKKPPLKKKVRKNKKNQYEEVLEPNESIDVIA